jgi:cysteine desulfurase family protein
VIYLDNAATSFPKPVSVTEEQARCMRHYCGNPGRGSHALAMAAAEKIYECRCSVAELFGSKHPENVMFTVNTTTALNTVIKGLLRSGDHILLSDMEHNATFRPIYKMAQEGLVSYDVFPTFPTDPKAAPLDVCRGIEALIKPQTRMLVCAHASNICSAVLPLAEIGTLCRRRGILFVVDAAQSAGALPVEPEIWGANFVAMPGHKGLLAPQGTGILLCKDGAEPLLMGGTGSDSRNPAMPEFLPDRLEAGTLNVPGIAGLGAGLRYVIGQGTERIGRRERSAAAFCVESLRKRGLRVFGGEDQLGTLSFLPQQDPEEVAEKLARHGIALRAGLHCAPLAHESAGTLERGTVRVSFGHDATLEQVRRLLQAIKDSEVM